MSRKYQILILFIFSVSVILRAGLVRYNRWSNDDHVPVVEYILQKGKLPEKPDCWECYQPKFFYSTAVKILELPWIGDALLDLGLARALGRINFIAGLITLVVVGLFVTRLPFQNEIYKILSFGLIALNPKLIGINSQATNDTFAILFSTLALYCAYLYLKNPNRGKFLLLIMFVVMAISSKTNTLVTFIAITMALFIKGLAQIKITTRPLMMGFVFALSVVVISILNPLNQYISNYEKYGSPTLTNIEKQPFPHLFKKTIADRPGILSIADGFFTFKYFDLLQHPVIDNGDVYAKNRTSLWTQLYGRAHSVHFDNWPKLWASGNEDNFARTRIIYIFAIIPTFLFVFGFFRELYHLMKSLLKRDYSLLKKTNYGLGSITFIGYVLLLVIYLLMYRRFSSMKVIFIYPSLIFFPAFFLSAVEYVKLHLGKRSNWLWVPITIIVSALLVLYILDVYAMIQLINSRVNI